MSRAAGTPTSGSPRPSTIRGWPRRSTCVAVKRHSRWGRSTAVAELCHDHLPYLPTQAASEAGGYETWNSLLPSNAGDRMVDTALQLLG